MATRTKAIASCIVIIQLAWGWTASAAENCAAAGPQTPRDIASTQGSNTKTFPLAPPAEQLNLCNIHFHKNAEHKGPGFSVSAGSGPHGGYRCDGTKDLTAAELAPTAEEICNGLKPGDTIEVHWVHTSCDARPGKGLGSCLTSGCVDPKLRVEAKVFLVVNDPTAGDFGAFAYGGNIVDKRHQAKALPGDTGAPVVFRGSTTGPSYNNDSACSPLNVTWSVRPTCAKIDIASMDTWCKGNVFHEDHAHGVRQLVTNPKLLAPIN